MPLNNAYDEQAVIQAIASALETFYGTLIEKIDGLNIQKVMKRKNPYLYRAKAMQSATEIVDSVLTAFVSSSEETIFGNCFFEPIAIAASGGNKALAEGIDIMIQNNETNTISAIAVKSGPSVFNADSKKRQEQNFTAASKLAQQAKARYMGKAYSEWKLNQDKESVSEIDKKYQKLLETLSSEQEEVITEYCNAIFSSGADTEEFFYRLGLKDGLNLKNTVKLVLEMIS